MKSANLAERLEEFEAVLDSLRPARDTVPRLCAVPSPTGDDATQRPERALRRIARFRGIQIRDQGLRAFRVR
jgi:hypothetical protein